MIILWNTMHDKILVIASSQIMSFPYDDNNYDKHTLYTEIMDATYEQILFVIQSIIGQLNVKCTYYINIVESKSGFRCAYIHLSNEKVYHAILGKNMDGTDRVSFIDDPEFVMPEEPLAVALEEYNNTTIDETFSWADDTDNYDDVVSKYKCPQIEVREESLVKIPNYKKNTSIILGCAYVRSVPKNYKNNILTCFNIPTWTTVEDLNNHFKRFNTYDTDNNSALSKSHADLNNKQYPIITIRRDKKMSSARVIFSEHTKDAQFALLFSMYITLHDKSKTKSTVLKFWYLKDKFFTGSQ